MSQGFGDLPGALVQTSAVVLMAVLGGCVEPPSRVRTYRSVEHSVRLDDRGWNDIVLGGTPAALYQIEPDAIILNLPAVIEPAAYGVYAGAPSFAPWHRLPDGIGVSRGDQPGGPMSADGTIVVHDWQPSSGGVFVDVELRSVRLTSESGSTSGLPGRRVTFWAFRGEQQRFGSDDPVAPMRQPARW